jgi:hypothetical protein
MPAVNTATSAATPPAHDPEFLAAIPGGHVLLPQPGEAPAIPEPAEEEEEQPKTAAVPEETEAEQEAEAETEEESDEEEEEQEEESEAAAPSPQAIRKMQKRISKLTARAKAAEAELTELRAAREPVNEEGAQQQPRVVAPQPSGSGPLADVFDIAELAERETAAENVMDWADANLDGATVTLENGEVKEYTAEEVRQIRLRAKQVHRAIPKRKVYLEALAKQSAVAKEVYPEIFDPKTELGQQAMAIPELIPNLKEFPDWHLFLGDWYAGRKARLANVSKAAGDPKAATPAKAKAPLKVLPLAPSAPRSSAAGTRLATAESQSAKQREDAQSRVLASAGSVDALEEFFMAGGR